MATPTRLAVLLHKRKSAAAGSVDTARNSKAAASANRAGGPASARFRSPPFAAARAHNGAPIPRSFASFIGSSESGYCLSVNKNGAEVGDVGERRTRTKQVADPIEESGRIVVAEKRGGILADRTCPI